MAKAVKGCMNLDCEANRKKRNFSLNDEFCPKCGQRISYVCKDCRMELDDDTRRYCVRCENKRRDNREQAGKIILGRLGDEAKKVGNLASNTGKKIVRTIGDAVEDVIDRSSGARGSLTHENKDAVLEDELNEVIIDEDKR